MSAVKTYNLPDVGEGLVEAEIVSWKVKVGDTVKVNDTIVEIETAKSLVELPSPFAGTISDIHVEEGVTVDVGTPIISIATGAAGGSTPPAPAPAEQPADSAPASSGKEPERQAVLVGYGPRTTSGGRRPRKGKDKTTASPAVHQSFSADRSSVIAAGDKGKGTATREAVEARAEAIPTAGDDLSLQLRAGSTARSAPEPGRTRALAKPPVRKLAKDMGIDLRDVPASGAGGIVTREDVLSFDTDALSVSAGSGAARGITGGGHRETRVPIKGVRKMTAQAMVSSAFTAPHVTEFITVDVTETMDLVKRLKADKEFDGLKVSPLLIVMKAMLLAIKRNPDINASWDEAAQEIVLKHYVNLGIAAATPRGLVVPNIKDAHELSLSELAGALKNLISTARDGKTQPAEMSDGTISITNVGVFGVDTGTPILNPGEAAILALGAIREMPWVVDGEIAVRWVTQLGLSFDHRLVDGDLGSRFLADIAAILNDPTKALVWG